MNIIELCGGLGNQLFQYAFGKTMESYGTEVYYNASWYNREYDPPRFYELDKFKVNVKLAPPLKLKLTVESKFPEPMKVDGCDFRGYWQHVQYYEKVLPILKNEFCVKEENYTEEFVKLRESIINCNSISVHTELGFFGQISLPPGIYGSFLLRYLEIIFFTEPFFF